MFQAIYRKLRSVHKAHIRKRMETARTYEMPQDAIEALSAGKTSLGSNLALPDIYDKPFLYLVAKKRYEEIVDELREKGLDVESFEFDGLVKILSKLMLKCVEIEDKYKDRLAKICINKVIDIFNVPEDAVSMRLELTDKVSTALKSLNIEPIDGEYEFEPDDMDYISSIKESVHKRRMLDALCIGASVSMASAINIYEDEINEIGPSLCGMYETIELLNAYLLFHTSMYEISDKNKMVGGTVEVTLGGTDDKVSIYAQGKIFPFLFGETIRGFMELFASHGLPKDRQAAIAVINKSDYLKAEPWDIILGTALWNIFKSEFNDFDTRAIPYIIKDISSLSYEKFNYLLNEMFSKTKKGRLLANKIMASAKNQMEYEKFADKMDKMKADKSIITDEFIGYDEL